jgi:glutaminase A
MCDLPQAVEGMRQASRSPHVQEWSADPPARVEPPKTQPWPGENLELGELLVDVYRRHLPLKKGVPAKGTGSPSPSAADAFAICAVTIDGGMVEIGDSEVLFPLLSLSKPFAYGLALEQHGLEAVRKKVGVEPTGTAFNGLIRHEELSRGRSNPMINLGAIATASLIEGRTPLDRQAALMRVFQRASGRPLKINERLRAHRTANDSLAASMAYFLQSEGLLSMSVTETLELYHTQCAVSATCRDLATMAASLANHGINPLTGERVMGSSSVKSVLSVMLSSGLYDLSGWWAHTVGLPAKSGLGGGLLAVVPGRLGIAVYSPRLDTKNRSVRGIQVVTELSALLKAHIFEPGSMQKPHPDSPCSRPSRRPLVSTLDRLHRRYASLGEGHSYISDPGISEVDPGKFGICAVSVDGRVQAVGDWQHPFLIQSISKVFVYGLALEDCGRDYVRQRVDVEPTGDPFDAIIKLEHKSKRPYNPMVNTGGIATTSLIRGRTRAHRLQRILRMYSRYMGKEALLDAPALLAEQSGGDRNRAISHLLRHFGMVTGDVDETLDLYLQQCSVTVTARDLAIMAATLAGGGVNPMNGRRAIRSEYVKDLLSVMFTCGMYDFAGTWAYEVGVPAKSGVGGGIMAVVPGEMGIAVYSPLLDERGNSVRGIHVFRDLSRELGLHMFDPVRL